MAIGQDFEVLDRLVDEGRKILSTLRPFDHPADDVRYEKWVRDCLDFTKEISREHHEQINELHGDAEAAFSTCQMILGTLDLVRSLLIERATNPPSRTLKQICYYRWESLRRNPKYRKDYEEFLDFCGKRDWDPENEFVRAEGFEIDPSKRKKVKYGLVFLEDPDKDIPKGKVEENPFWLLLRDRGLERPTWPSLLNPLYPKGEPVVRIYTDQFKGKMEAPLAFMVDLTFPKSEIMARVKRLVDAEIEQRKRRKAPVHRGRKQFRLYEEYLRVWDLRQKGMTFREIAMELYPEEATDDEDDVDGEEYEKRFEELIAQGKNEQSAYAIADKEFGVGGRPIIQRVFDQYRQAERLVKGGYREIR